jgi:VIT1/CCC1 family predicted Fe2+/Mn2+ transporter
MRNSNKSSRSLAFKALGSAIGALIVSLIYAIIPKDFQLIVLCFFASATVVFAVFIINHTNRNSKNM